MTQLEDGLNSLSGEDEEEEDETVQVHAKMERSLSKFGTKVSNKIVLLTTLFSLMRKFHADESD